MLRVNGPAVCADGCVKSSDFDRLDVAAVACPANCLQIIIIEKQVQVTFMRIDVVNYSRVGMAPALLQHHTATVVLAPVAVTQKNALP